MTQRKSDEQNVHNGSFTFQMDGLPVYSDDTNQQFDSAFLERVDTVRGANGIRTGVGVPSATVNMIRKRPGKTLGGSVAATVGRWDFYRLEADLNAPLTADGSVRSRFVVAPQKEHTFYNRNKKEKFSFMGIVEADLGSATTVSLGYQRQNNDPTAPIWGYWANLSYANYGEPRMMKLTFRAKF